jgi:hypothetical protein
MSTPKEHWRRDKHSFFNFLALDRGDVKDVPEPLHGLEGAVVSADPNSGGMTLVVEVPPGWKTTYDGVDASLEFFNLRGDMAIEGDRVGASGYTQVAQRCGGAELDSEGGALSLVFWNPNAPSYPPPYTKNRAMRFWEEDWHASLPDSHGIMHKSLRLPDPTGQGYDGGPAGHVRLVFISPGIDAPYEHVHHECFEEIILLQGDVMLADEGVMGIGSTTTHPQEWWHGPFATRSGCIVLVHTDAPMGYPWPPREKEYPIAKKVCEAYLDEAPWDVPTEHTPWADSDWAHLQDNPEFQKWAAEADEFGDKVGRDTISSFRAALRHEGNWEWERDRN